MVISPAQVTKIILQRGSGNMTAKFSATFNTACKYGSEPAVNLLSFHIDRSGQTVRTQIRLLLDSIQVVSF